MSNVSLTIGGRQFSVSCAAGEEAHVARLGRLIDEKAAAAGAVGQSETRMLLFAALMLADALDEATGRGTASAPTPAAPALLPELAPELAGRLDALAGRIENIASLLESDAANA